MATIEQKGFTLIEVMVVVTIIGLLSSSVLYSTRQMRERALVAQAKGEVQSIKNAFEIFYARFGAYPPLPRSADFCNMCAYWPASVPWANGNWNDIANTLSANGIIFDIAADPWGNPYLYDKNHQLGQFTCSWFSPICSMGPDGILQTPNCEGGSQFRVYGDDICVALDR